MDERVYARYMSDIAYFQSKLEVAPDSKYYIPVALAYNKLEKYQESIEICRTALENHPSDDAVKTLLAEAYVYTGHFEFAKELLFDIVTDNDFNYKAFKLLGVVYSSNDELGQALKYYKAAYIRAPEDTQLKQMIEDLGGSSNPDDILQERKTVSHAQTEEEDEENKAYYEIDRHIKNAEMIMADFVADGSIAGPKRMSNDDPAEEENTITDEEIERLLAGAVNKPESENDDMVSAMPEFREIEDEDLKKFMTKAHAELGATNAPESSVDELTALGASTDNTQGEISALEYTENISLPETIENPESTSSLLDILNAENETLEEETELLIPEILVSEPLEMENDEFSASLLEALGAENETVDEQPELPITELLTTDEPEIEEKEDDFSESLLAALGDMSSDTIVQSEVTVTELEDDLAASLFEMLDNTDEEQDSTAVSEDEQIDDIVKSLLDTEIFLDPAEDIDEHNDIPKSDLLVDGIDVGLELELVSAEDPDKLTKHINLEAEIEIEQPVETPSPIDYKLSIEDLVHDDFYSENISEAEHEPDIEDDENATPFFQNGIFDEIMNASGMDGYADEGSTETEFPKKDDGMNSETIEKLKKMQSKLMRLKGKSK